MIVLSIPHGDASKHRTLYGTFAESPSVKIKVQLWPCGEPHWDHPWKVTYEVLLMYRAVQAQQSFGMETDQDNQKNTWVFLQAAEPLGPYMSCAKGKAGSRHASLVPAMLASSNLGTLKSRFCRPENGWEMDNLKGLRQPEGLVYGIPKKATYMAKKNMINQKKKNRAAHVQTNQQTTKENCPMRLGLQKIAAHNVQLPRQLGNHFGA